MLPSQTDIASVWITKNLCDCKMHNFYRNSTSILLSFFFLFVNYTISRYVNISLLCILYRQTSYCLLSFYSNINNNDLRELPARGLRHVKHIRAHSNPQMRSFPQPHAFPFVQTLHLSYAYHCCPYMALGDSQVDKELTENITFVESASYTLGGEFKSK